MESGSLLFRRPHRRFNPLTREWILVSPHRAERPWLGQVEALPPETRPPYDPKCYLCPGNTRANGATNPLYASTYVFDNDFAALLPDTSDQVINQGGLFVAESERGICRVVIFSPRHDLPLPQMAVSAIREVVDVWAEQYLELGALPWINHVMIFENKGAMMGASNPHPHGQIWAEKHIPVEPAKEIAACSAYLEQHRHCLLCDYLEAEVREGARVVWGNEHFAVIVPFWAVWPFETLLVARRHVDTVADLRADERDALAEILQITTAQYDRLFQTSFPYSMGFHQRPTDGQTYPALHLHAHFYPPLLRSATVRKFMVGYELLANPQRDITAEGAAERLRALSGTNPAG